MKFRPCLDLRDGKVVQIVGGSLRDEAGSCGEGKAPVINFTTETPAEEFARQYRADSLTGGHVIALGPGNEAVALAALAAYPGGLQMGGGVKPENAARYLDAGASHVIVTSWVFSGGRMDEVRLAEIVRAVGRERLVLDLSCRWRAGKYYVVTERWQNFTSLALSREAFAQLEESSAEFLVHGVDVEGLRAGIDEELVERLGEWCNHPVTYAGGATGLSDLDRVNTLGRGRVDLTIGSALDLFGGTTSYAEVVQWNREHAK